MRLRFMHIFIDDRLLQAFNLFVSSVRYVDQLRLQVMAGGGIANLRSLAFEDIIHIWNNVRSESSLEIQFSALHGVQSSVNSCPHHWPDALLPLPVYLDYLAGKYICLKSKQILFSSHSFLSLQHILFSSQFSICLRTTAVGIRFQQQNTNVQGIVTFHSNKDKE